MRRVEQLLRADETRDERTVLHALRDRGGPLYVGYNGKLWSVKHDEHGLLVQYRAAAGAQVRVAQGSIEARDLIRWLAQEVPNAA